MTFLHIPSDADPRVPPDLEPGEAEIAACFGHLARIDGPAALRDAVLAERVPAASVSIPIETGRARRVPWYYAAAGIAAALLLSLGFFQFGRMAGQASERGSAETAHAADESAMLVISDPNMALFHSLETFDGLGASADELLAVGGG